MKRPARVRCSTNQNASAMLGPSTMMNRLYWGIVAPKSENEPASSGGRLTDFCCVPQKILATSLRMSPSAYVKRSW